jgi:type IV secretory pathway VirB10-like protein
MKRTFAPAALALAAILFSSCVEQPPKHPERKSGFHPPPGSDTQVANNPAPDENSSSDTKPANPDANKPAPDPKPQGPAVQDQPVAKGEIPYAKPVPGKPGFVFSPYDQYKGYIDVRGFPPGTEVKDPYSGKSFLVP